MKCKGQLTRLKSTEGVGGRGAGGPRLPERIHPVGAGRRSCPEPDVRMGVRLDVRLVSEPVSEATPDDVEESVQG